MIIDPIAPCWTFQLAAHFTSHSFSVRFTVSAEIPHLEKM